MRYLVESSPDVLRHERMFSSMISFQDCALRLHGDMLCFPSDGMCEIESPRVGTMSLEESLIQFIHDRFHLSIVVHRCPKTTPLRDQFLHRVYSRRGGHVIPSCRKVIVT